MSEKTNAHSGIIRSVKCNHDGTKIVSGSDDRTLKVWELGVKKGWFRGTKGELQGLTNLYVTR